MIDRGALVLARENLGSYRGVHRPALDAIAHEKRFKKLRERYRKAILKGDSVIDDLDEALALAALAHQGGLEVDVVVFEVPQEPKPTKGALPIAPTPPAEDLDFVGWDVIELLEPWCSVLVQRGTQLARNEYGLIARRADAEAIADEHNARPDTEDPVRAVRVWLARTP